MNIYKKTLLATTIPLLWVSATLTTTSSFAEECSDPCTVTSASLPEVNLIYTGASNGGTDWEIENANGLELELGLLNSVGQLIIEDGAASRTLTLDDSERLGINTSSPGEDIEIQSTSPDIRFDDSSGGGLQMDIGVNQTFMHIEGNSSQDIVHIDANAPANSIYIQPSGDVGIGTSNPDFAMHVRRTNGTAQVKISEDQATNAVKTLFSLVCTTCTPGFRFANNALSQVWFFRMLQNGNFSVDDPGTVIKETEFQSGGDMLIGGTLTQGSSRKIKHNIQSVDAVKVLQKLETLDIARWTYNHNDDEIVHMGPMAEDFYAAFELGGTDKGISTVDTAGVALAAIQALNQKLTKKDHEIQQLRSEINTMKADLAEIGDLKEMLVRYIEQDRGAEFSHVSF